MGVAKFSVMHMRGGGKVAICWKKKSIFEVLCSLREWAILFQACT